MELIWFIIILLIMFSLGESLTRETFERVGNIGKPLHFPSHFIADT